MIDPETWLKIEELKTDITLAGQGYKTILATDIKAKSPWADVRAFGAKGDGFTDDAPSIQAAVNAIHIAGGGGVYTPASTNDYVIDASIKLYDNIVLYGDGSRSRLYVKSKNNPDTQSVPAIVNDDFNGGNSNISIINISINGNRAGNTTTTIHPGPNGIHFEKVTNLYISNCYAFNCQYEGLYTYLCHEVRTFNNYWNDNGPTNEGAGVLVDTSYDVTISGDNYYNNGLFNLYISASHDVAVSGITANDTKAFECIKIANSSYRVAINSSSIINSTTSGIRVLANCYGVTINGCVLDNHPYNGIVVYNAFSVIVSGNICTNCDTGISIAGNSSRCIVVGNRTTGNYNGIIGADTEDYNIFTSNSYAGNSGTNFAKVGANDVVANNL